MSPRLRALIERLRARAGVTATAGAVALAVAGGTVAFAPAASAAPATPAVVAVVGAPARAAVAGVSSSGTIWLGMQAVTVTLRVASKYSGVPHACVSNAGPHAVAVVTLAVNGVSDRGRVLPAGGVQCLSRTWVKVAGAVATARFGVVDQANGIPGSKTLRVGGGYEPVRPTTIVAGVQLAAGQLAADGDYGPLTDARLNYIATHWRGMTGTLARVQRALGVAADGVYGPQTQGALEQLRNAAFGRY